MILKIKIVSSFSVHLIVELRYDTARVLKRGIGKLASIRSENMHYSERSIDGLIGLPWQLPCKSVEFDSNASQSNDSFVSVNVPRARIRDASIHMCVCIPGWMPVTRSHDPFPRRHSSHETIYEYVNGRRVVTILPANSQPPRITLNHK